nr:hypothetical protein HmN_000605900 [Hymenolepis microstoma]
MCIFVDDAVNDDNSVIVISPSDLFDAYLKTYFLEAYRPVTSAVLSCSFPVATVDQTVEIESVETIHPQES